MSTRLNDYELSAMHYYMPLFDYVFKPLIQKEPAMFNIVSSTGALLAVRNTESEAITYAEDLAKRNPGNSYDVFRKISSSRIVNVETKRF